MVAKSLPRLRPASPGSAPARTWPWLRKRPSISLSAKAVQWGLSTSDPLVSDDSGLALVLRVAKGYKLVRGSYALHIRFGDEPPSDQTPLSVLDGRTWPTTNCAPAAPSTFRRRICPASSTRPGFESLH